MDAQRNFPGNQESSWFAGERGYSDSDWPGAGDADRYPEGYHSADPRIEDDPRYGTREADADERLDEGHRSDPLGGSGGFRSWYGDTGGQPGPEPSYGGGRPATPTLPTQATAPARPAGLPGDPGDPGAPRGDGAALGDPGGRSEEPRSASAATGSLPPVVERSSFPQFETEPIERSALQRPTTSPGPAPEGVYRTRRPAVAIVIGLLTVLAELPALRLLLTGALDDPVAAPAIVAGTLLMIGLGLFALGIHALASGAAALADPVRFWFRPPTAYLTVGLALFVAAALAAT